MSTYKLTPCNFRGPGTIEFGSYYSKESVYVSSLLSNYNDKLDLFVKSSSYESKVDDYISKWTEAWAKNEAVHSENIPKIQEMDEAVKEIEAFMKTKGIESTYRAVDKKSRARFPKTVTYTSGFVDDIRRVYIRTDGFEDAKRICLDAIEKAKKLKIVAKQRFEQNKIKEKSEREKNKNFFELVKLNEQLGSPIEDIFELDYKEAYWIIKDRIMSKNNLLGLAIAMQDTRGDWSEGCDAVESNLFSPTNDIEKEIVEAVEEAVESFHDCQDGRVFRDCNWNYSEIFNHVSSTDPESLKLYQKLETLSED